MTKGSKYNGPITSDVEVVTPDVASEWLKSNTQNRNIAERRVALYIGYIKKAQWRDGVADIAFDTEGVLQNGQHTLRAITLAGLPAVCCVKRNMPVEAQLITDTAQPRRLNQQLKISGFVHATTIASAVKVFPQWIESATLTEASAKGDRHSATRDPKNGVRNDIELFAYCLANQEWLERLAGTARSRGKKGALLSDSQLMVLDATFTHFAGGIGSSFMAQFCNESDDCAQPVRYFQNALLKQVKARNKWNSRYRYAFAVKTFNAFAARTELSHLRWGHNESFPSIEIPDGATA